MSIAFQKTLSLLLLIAVGMLLKRKVKSKEQLGGIKVLILSIALPATIFVALLKIEIAFNLLILPVLALAFNVILFFLAKWLLPMVGVKKNSPDYRTYLMLIPSLAPGLSCFPFVIEYLGEESLAHAALTDVGNKIFVLIILYLLAMQMYYSLRGQMNKEPQESNGKLKGLLMSLLNEPVNLVILTAIGLLCVGLNLKALPVFLQDTVLRMSALMTPMVLLFIGMAVKFNRQQFSKIFQLILLRSGLAFIFSALLITFIPLSPELKVLAVIFPQSAASFWPFAHMSAVNSLPIGGDEKSGPVFNLDLGLNFLALSLPFSTILILGICSAGTQFVTPSKIWIFGLMLLGFLFFQKLMSNLKSSESNLESYKQHVVS